MIFNIYTEMNNIKRDCHNVNKSYSIGLTSGCFDLFHYYHLYFLERCKRYCDKLIVGIDSDVLVALDKGENRPIINETHRACVVDALKIVDYCFIMNSRDDFRVAAFKLMPEYIFKNTLYEGIGVVGAEFAQTVMLIPDVKPIISTTEIVNKIIANKTI